MKYEQRRSAIGPQKYLKMKRWEVLDPNDRQYTIWGAPIEYPPPLLLTLLRHLPPSSSIEETKEKHIL